MKRKSLTLKTLTAIAFMAFFSITVSTYAADSFLLDVWEGLEIWEQNNGEVYVTVTEAYSETMSMNLDKVKIVHTSFLFDDLKEINELDGIDWHDWEVLNVRYGGVNEKKTNPYWYPDEYRTP